MKAYDELIRRRHQSGLLGGVISLLGWDQEIEFPEKNLPLRIKEIGMVAGLHHDMTIDPEIGNLLDEIKKSELTEDQAAQIREISFNYGRATKIPTELVQELEELSAKAKTVWAEARQNNDYAAFAPYLEKIVSISKQFAKAIDPKKAAYDVLFEDYEHDISIDELNGFFTKIRDHVVPLIQKIAEKEKPDTSIITKPIPIDTQKKFNHELAETIGYDFGKGKIAVSTHPFTGYFGRITTRYEGNWISTIMSTFHEVGHGIYSHNLPPEHYGTPLGYARSLSIHESQSRLMENLIGRSQTFWKPLLPKLNKDYGLSLKPDEMHRLLNVVEPGYIRVEADELTYTLHIILRFEIENELMSGKLSINDLPNAWNKKMEDYLGLTPPTDTLGCLQDIHWSIASIAYFPTYTLGTMIASQLFTAIEKDIPKINDHIEKGDLSLMNEWLNQSIHRHGQRYTTKDLIRRATDKDISPDDYISYLEKKYSELYNL